MDGKKILCPACGAEMDLKLENFSIGADGGGGLLTLLADTYEVDLYACPQCGKVELYTYGFQKKEDEPEEPTELPEEPPEEPAPKSGGPFGLGKKKEKRPPWEK